MRIQALEARREVDHQNEVAINSAVAPKMVCVTSNQCRLPLYMEMAGLLPATSP